MMQQRAATGGAVVVHDPNARAFNKEKMQKMAMYGIESEEWIAERMEMFRELLAAALVLVPERAVVAVLVGQ